MEKAQRQSNIELCRIVCMLLVIMHHCVFHGGAINLESGLNKNIALLFYPGGKICFDAFIAISMWFLVDGEFRTRRFLRTWFETLFYSVLTTALALYYGTQLSNAEIASAFFPISGGVQGYVQTYLAFYLLMPVLHRLSETITKNQTLALLGVLSILLWGVSAWQFFVWTEQSVYSRLGLFLFFYFLMLYLKRNPVDLLRKKWFTIYVFGLCWAIVGIQKSRWENSLWSNIGFLVYGEQAALNIIGGLALFFFFKELKIKASPLINWFAGASLAVLLLHDGHFSRQVTWSVMRTSWWNDSPWFFLYVPLSAILIYLICALIDWLRRQYLERYLLRWPKLTDFCDRIDIYLGEESRSES